MDQVSNDKIRYSNDQMKLHASNYYLAYDKVNAIARALLVDVAQESTLGVHDLPNGGCSAQVVIGHQCAHLSDRVN
jgi:hypothetical protein